LASKVSVSIVFHILSAVFAGQSVEVASEAPLTTQSGIHPYITDETPGKAFCKAGSDNSCWLLCDSFVQSFPCLLHLLLELSWHVLFTFACGSKQSFLHSFLFQFESYSCSSFEVS